MGDEVYADAPPPSGGLIRLRTQASDLGSWLGPLWAMLCGVLASKAFSWQGGEDWVRLALLALLLDAGWGTLWAALASTDWAGPVQRWHEWHKNRALARLPYTMPGTPGDRISHWMGRAEAWWREALWPICGSAVQAAVAALPLIALLGMLLGPEILLLSGAALALMQLGVIWTSGRDDVPAGWDGLIGIALPWLAGHAAFGLVSLPSASLAVLFALAWGSAWNVPSRGARTAAVVSQLSSAGCLIALHRPLAAGVMLLLLMPQAALLPWIRRHLPTVRFVRHTRPWLLAAMAVAALAL